MADSSMNPRTLMLTILVVALITCGMFWLNRSDVPLGYARYEKYGFSLLYPKLMNVYESGLPGIGLSPDPSDFAGIVQWQSYWEGRLDVFEVIWFVTVGAGDAQAELERFVAAIPQPSSVVRGVGEPFTVMSRGEAVDCTYIEVEEEGYAYSGVLCVVYRPWSSPGLDRVFLVGYVTIEGSAIEEQLRTSFQAYMDDFHIHEPE